MSQDQDISEKFLIFLIDWLPILLEFCLSEIHLILILYMVEYLAINVPVIIVSENLIMEIFCKISWCINDSIPLFIDDRDILRRFILKALNIAEWIWNACMSFIIHLNFLCESILDKGFILHIASWLNLRGFLRWDTSCHLFCGMKLLFTFLAVTLGSGTMIFSPCRVIEFFFIGFNHFIHVPFKLATMALKSTVIHAELSIFLSFWLCILLFKRWEFLLLKLSIRIHFEGPAILFNLVSSVE